MAITQTKTYNRLFQTAPRRGKRRSQRKFFFWDRNPRRYLSQTERELILDICKILSLKIAIIAISKSIGKLGGFCARSTWGIAKERISELYDERRKFREELKFHKKSSNQASVNNHNSPHYAAKVLQIDVELVYRVLRKYAWTRSILFQRDRISSESQTTLNQAGYATTSAYQHRRSVSRASENVAQGACKRADLCAAPNVVTKEIKPPQPNEIESVQNIVNSSLRFRIQYAEFLLAFDPPDFDAPKIVSTTSVDAYFRVQTADEPPCYESKKGYGSFTRRRVKGILGFKELMEQAYRKNLEEGRVLPQYKQVSL